MGTVSCGTLRLEDLIPAFTGVLEEYWPKKASQLKREYVDVYTALDACGRGPVDRLEGEELVDAAGWLLEDLFDALDELAPEGYYFGASEGDGADFGFWPLPEEEWEEAAE